MLKQKLGFIYSAYDWANDRTGGIVEIIITAARSYEQERGALNAASIAYLAIFSFFPLVLFLVSVLGFVLNQIGSPEEIAKFITDALPVSGDLVYNNLVQILNARSISGIIGLVGLIWAASSVFTATSLNINRAWTIAPRRNIFQHRFFALIMIFTLLLFTAGWIFSHVMLSLIPNIVFPFIGQINIFDTSIWEFIGKWLPWVLGFFILFGLYYLIPNMKVAIREAFWGAIIASVMINLATRLFTWFIGSGLASFEVIYGSLGAGFALVTWVYLCAAIVIIGAHISASIAEVTRINNKQDLAAEDHNH